LLHKTINSRWFALLALAGSAAIGFMWYAGNTSSWPLLLLAAPLLILFAFSSSHFTLPLAVVAGLFGFALTAAIGVLAAYQPITALAKFWILIGSILLFFGLVAQPLENLKPILGAIALLGLVIGVYFLLTHDWEANPADLGILNRVAMVWMAVRPTVNAPAQEPNFVGGILAVFFILTAALGVQGFRERSWLVVIFAGGICLLLAAALLLTSSRAAWGALAVGGLGWGWWEISRRVGQTTRLPSDVLFRQGVFIFLAFAAIALLVFPSQIFAIARAVPGENSAVTRAGLFINAVELIPDFWLTGGGLQSFAGLYSQYILGIPFLFFEYSHNLYLDITIGQGILGAGAFLLILGSTGLILIQDFRLLRNDSSSLQTYLPAVFACWIIFCVHGLLDDPFYGERGTPLLFLIPGIALLIHLSLPSKLQQANSISNRLRQLPGLKYWLAAGVLVLTAAGLIMFQPVYAAAQANLGAVQMAKVELADFPSGSWPDGSQAPALAPAVEHFNQALWYNPNQPTANYRMGLAAMLVRDYPQAIHYLKIAYQSDPAHRGIQKALGYSYTWAGDFQNAYALLAILPEAPRELESYAAFWQQQGRPDLAANAVEMEKYLQLKSTP
jgi:tetratricopeptide (TPR) repeat protein